MYHFIPRFYQKHRESFDKFDAVLLNNPVLERGLTIAPVIVAGNSVVNGVGLSIAFGIITFFTVLTTLFVPKRLPYTFRVIANALVASLFYIPAAMYVEHLFPGSQFNLGIYLPLLVVNSLIVQKSESRFHKQPFLQMLLQLFCNIVGFFLVTFVVSAIREVLGKATFLGQPVSWMPFKASAVLLPFGGFLIVGFLAAFVKRFTGFLTSPIPEKNSKRKRKKEAAEE